jgi:hypothetical protein
LLSLIIAIVLHWVVCSDGCQRFPIEVEGQWFTSQPEGISSHAFARLAGMIAFSYDFKELDRTELELRGAAQLHEDRLLDVCLSITQRLCHQ